MAVENYPNLRQWGSVFHHQPDKGPSLGQYSSLLPRAVPSEECSHDISNQLTQHLVKRCHSLKRVSGQSPTGPSTHPLRTDGKFQ